MVTNDPIDGVSIVDALKEARPKDNDRWDYDLKIVSGKFRVNTAADWGGISDCTKHEMVDADLPELVILDRWFLEQLGKWKLRDEEPSFKKKVICREDAQKDLVDYVFDCAAGPPADGRSNNVWSGAAGWDWKCQLKSVSGVSGIGKSTVLSKVGSWVQERVDVLNDTVAAGAITTDTVARAVDASAEAAPVTDPVPRVLRGFKVASLSYGDEAPDFTVPRADDPALTFGHHLLRTYNFSDRWLDKVSSLGDALRIMRGGLGLDDTQLLIVTVDDIIELDRKCNEAGRPGAVREVVSSLMRHQGWSLKWKKQPTIFLFSSILPWFFHELQLTCSVCNTELSPVNMPRAHKLLFDQVPGLEDTVKNSCALSQLITSCMGNPKALFEGIVQTVDVKATNHAVAEYREKMLAICELNALQAPDSGQIVATWFQGTVCSEFVEHLTACGVLDRVDGKLFLLPLALHDWAQRISHEPSHPQWALAHHLRKAYDADGVDDVTSAIEDLLLHYEAVRRIGRAERSVDSIGCFYTTKYIGEERRDEQVKIKVPSPLDDGIVAYVDDFANVDAILELLRRGFVVASKKRTGQGLEYVSPFFDSCDETAMYVVVAQAKFQDKRLEPESDSIHCEYDEEEDEDEQGIDQVEEDDGGVKEGHEATQATSFTHELDQRGITWFRVVYATQSQKKKKKALNTDACPDGVYFTELSLFDFTKPLGILRIHLEMMERGLQHRCPSLVRPQTSKRRRNGRKLEAAE